MLFDGPLRDLQNRFGSERELVVDFSEDYEDVSIDGATVIAREGNRVTYRFPRGQMSASELIQRLASRYRIIDLTVREPAIEDTVRRIYEKQLLAQTPPA